MGEERGVTVIHHIVFSFSRAQSPLTISVTVTIGARLPAEDAILEHGKQKSYIKSKQTNTDINNL